MKAVAFNGSPRQRGNTALALEAALGPLVKAGVSTQIIWVGGESPGGCRACGWCKGSASLRCVLEGDSVNQWLRAMEEGDAVILGCPVYFVGIPGGMKCFLDRAFYVNSVSGGRLRMKPAAAVTVARRAGGLCALDSLNHYLSYAEMTLAGSYYWNLAFGHRPGEVRQDEEGAQIMERLGQNLLYLMEMRASYQVPLPEGQPRRTFNYIR